jgi:hypothetical protein
MTETMKPEVGGGSPHQQQRDSVGQSPLRNPDSKPDNVPRQPGSATGKLDIKANFDEPLPEWLLEAFVE